MNNLDVSFLKDEKMMEKINEMGKRSLSIDAIPCLEKLSGEIFEILSYVEDQDNAKNIKENSGAVRAMLTHKYQTVPGSMIGLLMDEENREKNIERIIQLLEGLKESKSSNTKLSQFSENFTEKLNKEMLYPAFGGTKDSFEKALMEETMKKKRNINIPN
jgi:hypothetical protein